MGFGAKGSSASSSSNQAPDFPAIQKPFLQNLWEQAQQASASGPGSQSTGTAIATRDAATGRAAARRGIDLGQQFRAGNTFGQRAIGTAANDLFGLSDDLSGLSGDLSGLAGQGQTDQLIRSLGGDINQQLTEGILPGLRSQEVGVGALGGSRGEIAQGLAVQGAQDAFGSAAAGIRQSDLFRRQDALGQAGQLTSQAGQLTQQAGALGQVFGQFQGLGSELEQDSANQLLDLGLAPSRAFWQPLQNYAALLNGSPQIGSLGRGSSRSRSFGFSVGLE